MANVKKPTSIEFKITLDEKQANVMLDALQMMLAKQGDNEQRAATILAIESILASGIAHSKER